MAVKLKMKQESKKKQKEITKTKEQPQRKATKGDPAGFLYGALLFALAVTGVCLSPMLQNTFTNWDDNFYITSNELLRGPGWKGIFSFSQPVVSNYHPLTILSLAMNYHLSELEPSSYYLFNLLLHLFNTALVFYFVWLISDKKVWVALFTSLVFGIHPMHVESVAWIAERKDVLYTFFFLLSLITYWLYIGTAKYLHYGLALVFFLLSLLSKPAAVILPLVLLLLDYWKGRKFSAKVFTEKIPFLLLAVLFGILTVQIQSQKAIADLEQIPLWARFLFAGYGALTYLIRFVIPYPLSAFHPYFALDEMTLPILFTVIDFIALGLIWYYRKSKLLVFGMLFFIVNLLLVLQVVAIGSAMIAERYTYVPYIGLAFLAGMWLNEFLIKCNTMFGWMAVGVVTVVFGTMTYARTKVWKDSPTMWGDVIKHYPKAPVARNNRANANFLLALEPANVQKADSLLRLSVEDCSITLSAKPRNTTALENRGSTLLQLQRYQEALADAELLLKLEPANQLGYRMRGKAYAGLNEPQKALEDFNRALSMKADDDGYYSRGSLLFNQFQKYEEALADFNRAIALQPRGLYYMTRSFCYYKLGNPAQAKADAQTAMQMGQALPESYRSSLGL